MADNVIAFSFVIYTHLLFSPFHFQNSLSTFSIERVNGIPNGISTRAIFKEHLDNNHRRIIYRNDNIARLVKGDFTLNDF